jgi:hypothetical protein
MKTSIVDNIGPRAHNFLLSNFRFLNVLGLLSFQRTVGVKINISNLNWYFINLEFSIQIFEKIPACSILIVFLGSGFQLLKLQYLAFNNSRSHQELFLMENSSNEDLTKTI